MGEQSGCFDNRINDEVAWLDLSTCKTTTTVVFNYQKVSAADMPGPYSNPVSHWNFELAETNV